MAAPKQSRKSGPKVKTGCQTCKIRRVKCDETKPSCKRCTSTGRKCDGYNPSSEDAATSVVHRIATHPPGSASERRGLSYFLNNTAPELSGYFTSEFWGTLILQASAAEPSLRHTVVAIGALHEEYAKGRLGFQSPAFAVGQYGKAIGHLRRSLELGKQSPLAALMSCILFVCFDSIRAEFTTAMVHLQSGLRILRDLRKRPSLDSYMIETTIAPLLMRLSLQAILFVDTRSQSDRIAFATELLKANSNSAPIPATFSSLEEARNSMCAASDGFFASMYMTDGDLPCWQQPAESIILHDRFAAKLKTWNCTFEGFMNARSSSLSSREVRGAALLKIQHIIVSIMCYATGLGTIDDPRKFGEVANAPETFEPLLGEFETVVRLSASLIATAEQDARAGKPALTFSCDLGLIGPLYYVCTHCTDVGVRRAALELIQRCPRREGMWCSEATGRMIEEYWAIEKRHEELQVGVDGRERVLLGDIVDLGFEDGMKWCWRWRDGERDGRVNKEVVPGRTWTDVLEGQGLFGGFFLTGEKDGDGG